MKQLYLKTKVLLGAALIMLFTSCQQGFNPISPTLASGEQGAILTLGGKKDIKVWVTTLEGNVEVIGCSETTCSLGKYNTLHAKGDTVILKGKITSLQCTKNELQGLDVKTLLHLTKLYCSKNNISTLDVQNLTNLEKLVFWENQISSINVKNLTKLKLLSCGTNKLNNLDVQGLTKLEILVCSQNQIASLNIQGLNTLQALDCDGNKLENIDIQGLLT